MFCVWHIQKVADGVVFVLHPHLVHFYNAYSRMSVICIADKSSGRMLCAFKSPDHVVGKPTSTENEGMGTIQPDGMSARCNSEKDVCFSYYYLDPGNKSKISIQYQGLILIHFSVCVEEGGFRQRQNFTIF